MSDNFNVGIYFCCEKKKQFRKKKLNGIIGNVHNISKEMSNFTFIVWQYKKIVSKLHRVDEHHNHRFLYIFITVKFIQHMKHEQQQKSVDVARVCCNRQHPYGSQMTNDDYDRITSA